MNDNRCFACKVMKRNCGPNCVFVQNFPLINPKNFQLLHKTFGAENVSTILGKLDASQQKSAINDLCCQAEARERDPIFGNVGMLHDYQHEIRNLEEQISTTKNELATIVGPDRIPQYPSLPMPNDFMITNPSLHSYIANMEGLDEVQKNELMQLPPAEAQKILTEMFRKREDEKMREGHGDDGASTSVVPSMAFESTNAIQNTLPLPQNQNQP